MDINVAEAFPPGEFIEEELEERGWTQETLAEIMGVDRQIVSDVIGGRRRISIRTARRLGAAFGTSAEYWLNLQNLYELHVEGQSASDEQLSDVQRRARLNELAPISALQQRGLLPAEPLTAIEAEVCRLFGMDSIHDEPADFRMAARRSNRVADMTRLQRTWVALVRRRAEYMPEVAPFSEDAFREMARKTAQLTREPESLAELPRRFAEVGVRLCHFGALPGSKIDGCTMYLDEAGRQPIVGISGRGKRFDKVLFTILHELAHLACGHVSPDAPVVSEGEHVDGIEREADDLAATWLLPEGLATPPARIRRPWVDEQAAKNGVHPIVVIGRLQHEGRIPWRSALARNAPQATEYLARWA